jgi:Zn-dependent peptidase ImmA (M78 family)
MSRIESRADALLAAAGITRPPVPVDKIARKLGVDLVYRPFEGNISAMLFRDGDRRIIGVNSSHVGTRQRFSIAHELGHHELHPGREVTLDRVVRIDLRDRESSSGSDRQEIAANQFAAELLMPRQWVTREVSIRVPGGRVPDQDRLANDLAKLFEVSLQAMQYRLVNLGIVQQT